MTCYGLLTVPEEAIVGINATVLFVAVCTSHVLKR